jgi:hypothetical protein
MLQIGPDILKAKPAKQEAAWQEMQQRIAAGEKLKRAELKVYHELERRRDPDVIHGYAEAAEYCGMSKRTLSYHLGRGKFKQNADGTFDKKELNRFLAESKDRRRKSPEEADLAKKKDAADLRYRNARARREEMLVEQMKGNLASRKEVYDQWAARLRELVSGLYAFADRLSGLIVGKSREDVHEIIRAEVRLLLENYERDGRYTPAKEASA